LPKKSSYQPLSPQKNHIDSQKTLTHQPISSFKPQHNTFIERNTKIPKCFKCQGYGHIALDCVNHKVFIIVNEEINNIFEDEKENIHESFEAETMGEPIYDEEYVDVDFHEVFKEEGNKDPIYDDEYVHDDIHEVFEKEEKDKPLYDGECESLVARRSLQTTTDKEELGIKHNILHTSNTSQGKVYDIIINSGSCESVVLNDMVENLKLPTKKHLHPYKLQRLNKENEILEKPWQYDRHALCDGYANTYNFAEDGIKIKLAPLPINEYNEVTKEFKSFDVLVTKEIFKEKTKLYMSRPVPKPPWEDVTIDFSLGILWTMQQKYSEMIVKDKFLENGYFILCLKVIMLS